MELWIEWLNTMYHPRTGRVRCIWRNLYTEGTVESKRNLQRNGQRRELQKTVWDVIEEVVNSERRPRAYEEDGVDWGLGEELGATIRKRQKREMSSWPGVAVHAYNPCYVEGIDRKIFVWGQPGKSTRPYLINSLRQKGLEAWLKWQSTWLPHMWPWVQTLVHIVNIYLDQSGLWSSYLCFTCIWDDR